MSLETTKKEVSQSSFTYSTTVPKRDNRGSCHNSRFTTLWQTSAKFYKLGGEQLSALARHVDWYLGGRRVLTGAGFLMKVQEERTPRPFNSQLQFHWQYTTQQRPHYVCQPYIAPKDRREVKLVQVLSSMCDIITTWADRRLTTVHSTVDHRP